MGRILYLKEILRYRRIEAVLYSSAFFSEIHFQLIVLKFQSFCRKENAHNLNGFLNPVHINYILLFVLKWRITSPPLTGKVRKFLWEHQRLQSGNAPLTETVRLSYEISHLITVQNAKVGKWSSSEKLWEFRMQDQ